jgi:hypothetical protein
MTIEFEFDTECGIFRDANTLPEDHTFTDDEIESMKQERLTNWLAAVKPALPLEQI